LVNNDLKIILFNIKMDEEIKQLQEVSDELLKILKTNPPNYRTIYNKYVSIRAKIRYRTNPEIKEYKRKYYNNLLVKQHLKTIST
jgi:hypothetical protein